MYSLDTVRMAMSGGDEQAAGKKLQEAVEAYKKGKDTLKSIGLFKEAILLKPTPKAYYELAGALLTTRQYPEAIQALGMAEKLGYTPLANVMFRYAYASANMDSMDNGKEEAVRYMELAMQMGYAHPEKFLQKSLFPGMSDHENFDAIYSEALRGGPGLNNTEKSLWQAYAAQFPPIHLPLTVNKQWLENNQSAANIAYQYERFIPNMRDYQFSREGGKAYRYIALLRQNDVFTAVLYSAVDDNTETPLLYLATYSTKDGTLIEHMPVAGVEDMESPYLVFTIQGDLKFSIQELTHTYKEDPEKEGYDSSNISGEKALPPNYLQITAQGKIEPTTGPVALR